VTFNLKISFFTVGGQKTHKKTFLKQQKLTFNSLCLYNLFGLVHVEIDFDRSPVIQFTA
jgi:hypothetical protein